MQSVSSENSPVGDKEIKLLFQDRQVIGSRRGDQIYPSIIYCRSSSSFADVGITL
jgi:hypothetical protein